MSLTLTFSDAADGTGGTATIAGSDSGSANTIYAQQIDSLATPAWSSAGTRTGDGTVTLSLAPGYYWGYVAGAVSSAAALSVPIPFGVTRSTDSVQTRVEKAVVAAIQAMCDAGTLPNLPRQNVVRMGAPNLAPPGLPACILSPGAEIQQGQTTGKDDYGRPVVVTLADRKDPALEAPSLSVDVFELWRERIVRRFISQHLPGVTEAYNVKVDFAPIITGRPPEFQVTVSSFTLRVWCREPRGV